MALVKDEDLIIITEQGMGIKIKSTDISTTSRVSSGVKGITLVGEDKVLIGMPIRDINDNITLFSENGLAKKFPLSELPVQNRAGKGLICYKPTSSTGKVSAATLTSDEDIILISGNKNSICIACNEIPTLSRASVGNQVIKNNIITSVSKI